MAPRLVETRPNLELNESDFESGFGEYAKETIKRYEQSNLKIERFKLELVKNCCGAKVKKLIVKALTKLGATRLILLLNGGIFVLPCVAVFGGDNQLVELSVKGRCQIFLDGKVKKCSSLESLCLDGIRIKPDTLVNIISSCPFIEKLSLSNNNYVGQLGLTITHLDRLKCLVLYYESFEAFFPAGDLLSKLPLLKDFTLLNLKHSCLQREGGLVVQISNCSLEHLKIELENEEGHRYWGRSDDDRLKVKVDVPSIRKFTFEGGVIPELCFASSSCTREWESHVSFANYYRGVSLLWFHELNEFLKQLRQSKIHLSLNSQSMECYDYRFGDLSVTRRLELESLTIGMTDLPSFNCYALLDGLFRMCRPKLITHLIQKEDEEEEGVNKSKSNIDMLWDAFEQGRHVSIPRQLMYGLKDLEDVNAQIFEDDVWRPLLFEEQDEQQQQKQQRIRFLLKWKPS